MMIRWRRFNLYLCGALILAVVAAAGCRTAESRRKNQLCVIRLHLEAPPDGMNQSQPVPIYRQQPINVNILKEPFLGENSVKGAKVVDVVGGFALSIQFDHMGARMLEQYSTSSRGARVAIFSLFGEPMTNSRWLAAPILSRPITNGVLIFTPDTTRAEADSIALGLNNDAKHVSKISREE
jgi:hypothetical protein